MALVTSATDITVIVLNNNEATALADVLEWMVGEHPVLDELTHAMLGEKLAFAYDGVDDD